ncbi:ribosomal protein S18-alanine N-acetyltransferase [Psychrobacter maritimus]|uniref:ribosomal protein S18-alanine N-acetyltransferase n=1 Tax=Psychrobacter maritimus TaxID=256325 RepID=UPI0039AFFF6D
MFIIEKLATHTSKRQKTIEAVANIELLVQPHDVWTYQTLVEMLAQNSMHMLMVYEQEDKADNNKVIGYCLYQVIFEQAEILRIGTHPDYQRQGIASQIFTQLNEELMSNQVESLLLEVRSDNFAAIALYQQQAFAVIHTRRDYYQVPHQPAIDALIMQRVYV